MKHGVRPNPGPVATLEGQPEWDLVVHRIVASPHLAKSPRLISLPAYVSRMTIEGRSAELTESHIGINVFGRPEGYNCSEDNIVRSHARLLRQKLDAPSRIFWSRVFQPHRNTILVPADSGLVMYENLTRRPVHLAEYLSRQYLSAPMPSESDPRIKGLGQRRYTRRLRT